jgi:hypothetical protein
MFGKAKPRRYTRKEIEGIRAASGSAEEVARTFKTSPGNVSKIKRGIIGHQFPYTFTVSITNPRPVTSLKLASGARSAIEMDHRRGRAAADELSEIFGVTAARIIEIWREYDYEVARRRFDLRDDNRSNESAG